MKLFFDHNITEYKNNNKMLLDRKVCYLRNKNLVPTSQHTHCISITKTSHLMPFTEIITVILRNTYNKITKCTGLKCFPARHIFCTNVVILKIIDTNTKGTHHNDETSKPRFALICCIHHYIQPELS